MSLIGNARSAFGERVRPRGAAGGLVPAGTLGQVVEGALAAEALDRRRPRPRNLAGEPGAPAAEARRMLVDPGKAGGLTVRRQRLAARGIGRRGGGERRKLGHEAPVLGEEAFQPGKVAGLARLHEAGELPERGGGHPPRRSRAARRIRSAKRTAAATAR